MPWIKLVHECVLPICSPETVQTDSIWQCDVEGCATYWKLMKWEFDNTPRWKRVNKTYRVNGSFYYA